MVFPGGFFLSKVLTGLATRCKESCLTHFARTSQREIILGSLPPKGTFELESFESTEDT